MPLTDLQCRHAQPSSKPYKLTDSEGLYLEVRPSGKRYWRQRYRVHNKEKVLTLGSYPALTLIKAREKRDAAKAKIEDGTDPSAEKQANKQLAKYNAAQTFELVACEWHERYRDRWSESHADNLIHRLRQYVFPAIGSVSFSNLTPPLVLVCVQKIEDRQKGELAKRILQIIGQVMRYAVATGRIERDFTQDLRGALKRYNKGHFASMPIDELPKLIKKLDTNENRLFSQTILLFRLMLLTFVRTSELIQARWSEINLEKAEWHIPAERMKMRIAHFVPLSKQAVIILVQLQELNGLPKPNSKRPDYVFPSLSKPGKAMSNGTILMALDRMGYRGKMTGHGFRSLAMSTIKEKLNYRHEVVDRQLAHLPRNAIDRAYDRAMFIAERIVMMQEWADYIDTLSIRRI